MLPLHSFRSTHHYPMTDSYNRSIEAADAIRAALQGRPTPTLAIIAGSGLGGLATLVADPLILPTDELPHWPQSSVVGHAGRLVLGTLHGQPVMVMQGRVHLYEGYDAATITFPIRVMQALGVQRLVVTNAAGGLDHSWQAGDIMLISDHINLPAIAGQTPLRGPNDERWGPRFPAMEHAYSPRLRALAHEVAAEQGLPLREGVYTMLSGPSYETPAELRFLRLIGSSAVGMSTAPEVMVARHAGIEVVGFSMLTNMVHFEPAHDAATNHEEVLEQAAVAGPRLAALIEGLVARLAAEAV